MCRDGLSSDGGGSETAPGCDAVVIVTGASCGTGHEVVRLLARRGCAIVVVYLDDQGSADTTVEEVFTAGGTAVAVRADVGDDLDVERLFDETIAAFGGVDAVVDAATQDRSVLYQHALLRLARGAAIVSASTAEEITPELARRLRERDIALIRFAPGADHGVADLVALLERRRRRPTA